MNEIVAILGSGQVAQALALGFKKHSYAVVLGNRNPDKIKAFGDANGFAVGTLSHACEAASLIVLAVKGSQAESIVQTLAPLLQGKVVIDPTNPISDAPPVNGVLQFFTGPNDSLMERLQATVPGAKFVKAFNCIGGAFMVNPQFTNGTPAMFICGDDSEAKAKVRTITTAFGFQTEDMGGSTSARALEPLCQLWCAPGFLRNEWNHALAWLR